MKDFGNYPSKVIWCYQGNHLVLLGFINLKILKMFKTKNIALSYDDKVCTSNTYINYHINNGGWIIPYVC